MSEEWFYAGNLFIYMLIFFSSNTRITKANVPSQCSWLNGSLSLSKDEAGRKLENNNFRYILVEGPPVKKLSTSAPTANNCTNNNGKEAASATRKMDEYKECLRDFNCNMMLKMGTYA